MLTYLFVRAVDKELRTQYADEIATVVTRGTTRAAFWCAMARAGVTPTKVAAVCAVAQLVARHGADAGYALHCALGRYAGSDVYPAAPAATVRAAQYIWTQARVGQLCGDAPRLGWVEWVDVDAYVAGLEALPHQVWAARAVRGALSPEARRIYARHAAAAGAYDVAWGVPAVDVLRDFLASDDFYSAGKMLRGMPPAIAGEVVGQLGCVKEIVRAAKSSGFFEVADVRDFVLAAMATARLTPDDVLALTMTTDTCGVWQEGIALALRSVEA